MMPGITLYVDPPDSFDESAQCSKGGVRRSIEVAARAPLGITKIVPEEPGADVVNLAFVAGGEDAPQISSWNGGDARAWVPVDLATLAWIKEQWALGRRLEVHFVSDDVSGEAPLGLTLGRLPDGNPVTWDKKLSPRLVWDRAVLAVPADVAALAASPTPSPLLGIEKRLDRTIQILVFLSVAFVVGYWLHR